MVEGVCHYEIEMPFPKNIPLGYHSLFLEASEPRGSQQATMTVIVVPDRGYLHSRVKGLRRAWGITLQLYGLRSQRNWGFGDFCDLTDVIPWAGAELGAHLLGGHAYPSWRIKAGPSESNWEDWAKLDRVQQLVAVMRAQRNPGGWRA